MDAGRGVDEDNADGRGVAVLESDAAVDKAPAVWDAAADRAVVAWDVDRGHRAAAGGAGESAEVAGAPGNGAEEAGDRVVGRAGAPGDKEVVGAAEAACEGGEEGVAKSGVSA